MTFLSSPPVAMLRPFGEKTTACSPAECARTGHPSFSMRPLLVTVHLHAPAPSCLAPVLRSIPLAASQSLQHSSPAPTLSDSVKPKGPT